ncbi:hypothetical protein Pmani_030692 [Petrolisthes manimaculis]|uniref:Uncharacterized protein n=1 Tax=Petrolisthes manimaculis TaxID=1843537 RepID=A0AAE1NWT3_9EUCA|nr:hypothetical protein Pmani_030692 [Petrolisthes manimaculis]
MEEDEKKADDDDVVDGGCSSLIRKKTLARLPLPSPPLHPTLRYHHTSITITTTTSPNITTFSTSFPPSPPHPYPTNTTTSSTFLPQIPSHPHSPTPTRPTPAQHHNLHFPGGYLWPVEQESVGLLSGGGGRKVLGRQGNFIGGADGFAVDGEK